MKKVGSNGVTIAGPQAEAEAETLSLQPGMQLVKFEKVEELVSRGTYYQLVNSNFESVDAVIHPQTLLQFFSF